MSTVRIDARSRYPLGTVVGAYPKRYFTPNPPQPGDAPVGIAAVATGSVEPHGEVVLAGLEANTPYWAGAEVAGVWTWVGFRTPEEAGGSSGGPATNGLPAGGTNGQILQKVGTTDYSATWANVASGGGATPEELAAEASARLAADNAEKAARITADATEQSAREAADLAERLAREAEDANLQSQITSGGGGSVTITAEKVDINNFINLKGEKKGITASAALGGSSSGPDAAQIIREAFEKALTVTGGKGYGGGSAIKGNVGPSEPGVYWLESTALSQNPTENKALKAGVRASALHACIHRYGGVVLDAPGHNPYAFKMIVGPAVWEQCERERIAKTEAEYQCVAINVEPLTLGSEHPCLGAFYLDSTAPITNWVRSSKTPPPFPDAMYAGAAGDYRDFIIGEGFRFGFVDGMSHGLVENVKLGGWARWAQTNWASEGARTGNTTIRDCDFKGGFAAIWIDSSCSLTGTQVIRGWFAYSTEGPIVYKPVVGAKAAMIGGVKFQGCQLEGGRGPLFYSEDGQGSIDKLTWENNQIGGDTVMVTPTTSDISLGYPLGGMGVDYFIKCSRITNTDVKGTLIPMSGWGAESGAILATEAAEKNNFGNLTEAANGCRFRGTKVLTTPKDLQNEGYVVENGQRVDVALTRSTMAIREGDILRAAATNEAKASPLGVAPYNKAGAVRAGRALLPAAANTPALYAVANPAKHNVQRLPLSNSLGYGSGENGTVPPPGRGGTITLTAALRNGTGASEGEHAPPTLNIGSSAYKGSLFVSGFGDLTVADTLSTAQGVLVYPRQFIALGTETTRAITITSGSNVVTLSSITGFAPGMKIKGTSLLPLNTMIEAIDGESSPKRLILNNKATGSGTPSITVLAPVNIIEGAMLGNSTRLVAALKLSEMTGSGTVRLQSALGLPNAGEVKFQGSPFAKEQSPHKITYSSKTTKAEEEAKGYGELKGCAGSGTAELPIGTIVAEGPTPPKLSARNKLFRTAQIAPVVPGTTTYTGPEAGGLPSELPVAAESKLPSSGLATLTATTFLPPAVTTTGNVTNGATIIKGMGTTAGIHVGDYVYATVPGTIEAKATVLRVINGTEIELTGRALLSASGTGLTFEPGFTKAQSVLMVQENSMFPEEGKMIIGGPGSNTTFKWTSKRGTNELVGTSGSMKCSQNSLNRLGGEVCELATPNQFSYSSRSGGTLKGVTLVGKGSTFDIQTGMTVTSSATSEGGGLLETSGGALYAYRGETSGRGLSYLFGIGTPLGGGELANATALTDVTVLPVQGGRFPAFNGSATTVVAGGECIFAYDAFVSVSGTSPIEAAPEEGSNTGGEEGGEGEPEEASTSENSAGGFFLGVKNVVFSGGGTAGKSGGEYTGGTQLLTASVDLKAGGPATLAVLDAAKFPSIGTLKVGKFRAPYTSLAAVETAFTGKAAAGATAITSPSTITGFAPGMLVTGAGVQARIKSAGATVVLYEPLGAFPLPAVQTAKTKKLKLTNPELSLTVGDPVSGVGILPGTTIAVKTSSTEIELSTEPTSEFAGTIFVATSATSTINWKAVSGEFKGLVWTLTSGSESSVFTKGAAVCLFPGFQCAADVTVRAAYGESGRSAESDVGVVCESSGTTNPIVGTTVEADKGGFVMCDVG